MDGENKGKPYEQMDDLGVFPYFWKHPYGDLFIWMVFSKPKFSPSKGNSTMFPIDWRGPGWDYVIVGG